MMIRPKHQITNIHTAYYSASDFEKQPLCYSTGIATVVCTEYSVDRISTETVILRVHEISICVPTFFYKYLIRNQIFIFFLFTLVLNALYFELWYDI